ncbi:META domain-containing protein [Sphingomonas sp. GCM10030256]|uniref:META domain-containing protein n=1 Tax=Sphingomonas sp. GCM10030256 TaxID=3273427 RepID=UPI003623ABE5
MTVPLPAEGPISRDPGYRALGTEPFWSLEIGPREMVFTEANAPGVRIVQPTPRPIVGIAGEIYQTPRINVNVVHARCSDGMSDRVYPDRVQVRVDNRAFEGCGGGSAVPTALAGTNWRVAAVNAMLAPPGDNFLMRFEGERVSARFGCNSMGGGYTYDGRTLVANRLAATRMACADMRFEDQASRILANPVTAEWRGGDRLTLSNPDGRIVLERSY